MVKKLKSTSQRFSAASRQVRATEREARASEKAAREKMLGESVVPFDILAPLPPDSWLRMTKVELDGVVIAVITRSENSPVVGITLTDNEGTHFEIRHVEECRQILTFRRVAVARMFPRGGASLVALIHQRQAEAEAAQLSAVAGQPTSLSQTNRL